MKHLVILGAGTAGTMVANRMARRIPKDWSMTVIDPDPVHLYQPGLLFIPFSSGDDARNRRLRSRTLHRGISWIEKSVERVDPKARRVVFEDRESLGYDLLVIASGARVMPEETAGLTGEGWRATRHEFYTLEGARALQRALDSFTGGRLLVNVVEMPIKCPVAPLEFLFLADAFFTKRGIRKNVEIVYATPLDGAFTKPTCNRVLSYLIRNKGIRLEPEFNTGEVDGESRTLRSFDDRAIEYDLLVSIPTHRGARFIEASDLGNELGFVPTHPNTLQSRAHDGIFVLGDATDLPSSKAGSVAHFQSEVLEENLLRAMAGRSLEEGFDGHANCFIETGSGKALLVDFNYQVEPLPGTYPLPVVGPMSLLKETRLNHLGKLAFRWIYWNALLPGRRLPVSTRLSMTGKLSASSVKVALQEE